MRKVLKVITTSEENECYVMAFSEILISFLHDASTQKESKKKGIRNMQKKSINNR